MYRKALAPGRGTLAPIDISSSSVLHVDSEGAYYTPHCEVDFQPTRLSRSVSSAKKLS